MDLARTAQVAETRQRKCAGGHAAGGLVEPVRDGRLASARADRYVLRQGRRFRLRFGACHRPFSVRGRGHRAPVADREAVRRRRGRGHDHTWAGGHYGCLYRLLVAGLPGASVAAVATFLPCYLFTIIHAPYFKKYGKVPGVVAFVDGITAAAIGAIAGSVIVIAKRTIVDVPTAVVAICTIALLWKFKKLQEPVVVVAAAVSGLIIYIRYGTRGEFRRRSLRTCDSVCLLSRSSRARHTIPREPLRRSRSSRRILLPWR